MLRKGNMQPIDLRALYAGSIDEIALSLEEHLAKSADSMEIPIAISHDKVMGLGLITGQEDDCLLIAHPAHKMTWMRFVIHLAPKNDSTACEVYLYGHSKSEVVNNTMTDYKGSAKEWRRREGLILGSLGFAMETTYTAPLEGAKRLVRGSKKKRLFGGFCGRDSGIGPAQRAKTTIWN